MSKRDEGAYFLPFLKYNEKHTAHDPAFWVAIIGSVVLIIIFLFSFLLFPSPNISVPDMFNRTHPENAAVVRSSRDVPSACNPGFHLDVPFGDNLPECIVNIPIPSAVDESLIANSAKNVCTSFSTYVCNKFVGSNQVIDFTFDSASNSANRMYDTVTRLTASQSREPQVRALYNFVLSCVYSSIRPNVTNDLLFAHDSLQRVEPEPSLNLSPDAIAGYALGASMALGNEAALSARATMNALSNGEAIIRWDIGMQMKMSALMDKETLDFVVQSACSVLSATGHFPYDIWIDPTLCKTDIESLYHAMARDMATVVVPTTTVAYLVSPQYRADLISLDALGDYVGSREFVEGIIHGIEAILDFDRDMLSSYGITVPNLRTLRQWAIGKDAVKVAYDRAKSVGNAKWLAYIKAMITVHNYQYSDTLTNLDESDLRLNLSPIEFRQAAPTPTHGLKKDVHKHRTRVEVSGHAPIPRISKKKSSKKTHSTSYARDSWTDESALVNSVMYDQCVFLAAQYFPEVDETFAHFAVPQARSEVVQSATERVRESVVNQIASSKTLDPESKTILVNRIRAIAVHEGAEYSGVKQPSIAFDIDADVGFLQNSVNIRRRNSAKQTLQVLACHDRKPADCLPTSHYIGRSGPEINAFFNPAAATLTVLPGMMHPIFFSEERSDISQMARGGVIIGHEFWHSVDDVGKMYDERGNLNEGWQTPAIREWLESQEKCFSKQIDSYTTPFGNKLKHENILGEVIADVRGANAALRSIDKKMTNSELREFLETLGQTWCSAIDADEEAYRIEHSDHPPPSARIDLMMRNLVLPNGQHAMATAYGCGKGTPMNPKKICEVV